MRQELAGNNNAFDICFILQGGLSVYVKNNLNILHTLALDISW